MEIAEQKVTEEQTGFRKAKGCMNHVLGIKSLVEEYLGMSKKSYAAFTDLEETYDNVDREALECSENIW